MLTRIAHKMSKKPGEHCFCSVDLHATPAAKNKRDSLALVLGGTTRAGSVSCKERFLGNDKQSNKQETNMDSISVGKRNYSMCVVGCCNMQIIGVVVACGLHSQSKKLQTACFTMPVTSAKLCNVHSISY